MSLPATQPAASSFLEFQLFGRDREWLALRERLAAALDGQGGIVLLSGEAGIGKTALVETLGREAADRGALFVTGRCYDVVQPPAYGPWTELLSRIPDCTADRSSGAAQQAIIPTQAIDCLVAVADDTPLVLAFEDLHWADQPSLELLRRLAREARTRPLLILATYCDDELDRRHPLTPLLATLERESAALRLDLGRWRADDLGMLVAAHYRLPVPEHERLATYLLGRASGNPFLTLQVLRSLEQEGVVRRQGDGWLLGDLARVGLPLSLRQIVDVRLLRLDDQGQALLAVAAVIGPAVPFATWAAVTGRGEEELYEVAEAAIAARLIAAAPDGMGFTFAHALVREALYAGILPFRRRALHRQVGEALLAGAAPDPSQVAGHLRRAGDARAAGWLTRAGERAEVSLLPQVALEHYEAAIALLETDASDTEGRGWLHLRAAAVLLSRDRQRALRSIEAAGDLAREATAPRLAARALLLRGRWRCENGELCEGLADLADGFAALDILAPGAGANDWHEAAIDTIANRGTLALWLGLAGQLAPAREQAEAHLAGMEPPDTVADAARQADGWHGLAHVHALRGEAEDASRAFAAARDAYQLLDQPGRTMRALQDELLLVTLPYRADDLARRKQDLAVAQRVQAAAGSTTPVGEVGELASAARLPILALEGEWAEARRIADALLADPSSADRDALIGVVGQLARAQGDTARAWDLVRQVWPDGPASEPGMVIVAHALPVQRLAVALALDAGDFSAARDWLIAHERLVAQADMVPERSEGQALRAQYYRATGDLERARDWARHALASAGEPRQPLALLGAHRLLGELARATGHHAEAREQLAAALALADACAAPYERALTLLAQAELHLAEGARVAADAALAAVRAICAPLGARPALARADALAARNAGGTRRVSATRRHARPAGLTTREAEVLGLMTRGLTNAQMAEQLFLSPRTVSHHLASAYGKLGVNSRAGATRLALEHGLS